jgi:hypothetical protein
VAQLAEYTNELEVITASARRTLISLLDSADEKPLGRQGPRSLLYVADRGLKPCLPSVTQKMITFPLL